MKDMRDEALKERKEAIKEGKITDVVEKEKTFKVPDATPAMSQGTRQNVAEIKSFQSVIDQNRETLNILTKLYENTSDKINRLEEKGDNKNEEDKRFLKKFKEEQEKGKKDIDNTFDALKNLEEKQKKNLEEIKKEIKTTEEAIRKDINERVLEKIIKEKKGK
jgi:membrane-associated HD superfamily phosphohydrolase